MRDEETSWGGVAEWYDKHLGNSDTFQSKVILPNLLRLMKPAAGDAILDLACGQGYFAYALAAEGADVLAADVSPELVALGQRHGTEPGVPKVTFTVTPSHDLRDIPDASRDRVLIVLAIQNIEDVKGTFAECARVLRPGGRLHLVLNHPAFRIPKGSSWDWDAAGNQYRRINRYLTEAKINIHMRPGDAPAAVTVSFHRPLQYFVKMLIKNGFVVTNLEEWISHRHSDSGPRAAEENRARREIPMFMYLEAQKPA